MSFFQVICCCAWTRCFLVVLNAPVLPVTSGYEYMVISIALCVAGIYGDDVVNGSLITTDNTLILTNSSHTLTF